MDEKRSNLKIGAGVFYVVAAVLIGIGFYVMYTYGSGERFDKLGNVGRVVGGDAYNYIIIAVRGVGWIAAGLAATVVGAACSICSRLPDPDAVEKAAVQTRKQAM